MSGLNRDDIIRMAKEAGYMKDGFGFGIWDSQEFNEFANLVAAEEREACAKLCIEESANCKDFHEYRDACQDMAYLIRARG